MSRYYSDEQLDRIKRALPRCVYLRESKKGLLSFLVRITLANGQKKTIGTFSTIPDAKAALDQYYGTQKLRAVVDSSDILTVDDILGTAEQATMPVPEDITSYLASLPPHEITLHDVMRMPSGAVISPAFIAAYLATLVAPVEKEYSFTDSISQPTTGEDEADIGSTIFGSPEKSIEDLMKEIDSLPDN